MQEVGHQNKGIMYSQLKPQNKVESKVIYCFIYSHMITKSAQGQKVTNTVCKRETPRLI